MHLSQSLKTLFLQMLLVHLSDHLVKLIDKVIHLVGHLANQLYKALQSPVILLLKENVDRAMLFKLPGLFCEIYQVVKQFGIILHYFEMQQFLFEQLSSLFLEVSVFFHQSFDPFNKACSLFKSFIIKILIFFFLLVFKIQLFLMVFFGSFCTLLKVSMPFPDFHTNPTELIFTKTSHMNASFIFFNDGLAHRASLNDHRVEPLILSLVFQVVPIRQIKTVQGNVVSLPTVLANLSLAMTDNRFIRPRIIYINHLRTSLLRTNFHLQTGLTILEAKQFIKVILEFWQLIPQELHEIVVGSVVAVFLLAHWEQFIPVSIVVMDLHVVFPAIKAEFVAANVVIQISLIQADTALSYCSLNLVILDEFYHFSTGLFLVND